MWFIYRWKFVPFNPFTYYAHPSILLTSGHIILFSVFMSCFLFCCSFVCLFVFGSLSLVPGIEIRTWHHFSLTCIASGKNRKMGQFADWSYKHWAGENSVMEAQKTATWHGNVIWEVTSVVKVDLFILCRLFLLCFGEQGHWKYVCSLGEVQSPAGAICCWLNKGRRWSLEGIPRPPPPHGLWNA